ncbi:signal peptidase I [Candidatus Aerophobetes bacterium]|uniref:Signal peptidase I n=1 Tax=Aerophobetes bacterium TaxID=2030807 RepID=A0A523RS10_UNCAE|nr:MAG: signal peptidase I [Candidatus Aerophobetes bacterium]
MLEKTEMLNLKREDFASIAQEVLDRGRILRFKAKGGSMSPFIQNGDVLEVVPLKGKINFGDIILYHSSCGNPIIHRVIQRGKESIITKGDSVSSSDQPILSKQVLGRVMAIEKNGWCIRLDKPVAKLLNILLALISPFSFLTYPPLRLVKRTVRLKKI